jgi:hypothetical protein
MAIKEALEALGIQARIYSGAVCMSRVSIDG